MVPPLSVTSRCSGSSAREELQRVLCWASQPQSRSKPQDQLHFLDGAGAVGSQLAPQAFVAVGDYRCEVLQSTPATCHRGADGTQGGENFLQVAPEPLALHRKLANLRTSVRRKAFPEQVHDGTGLNLRDRCVGRLPDLLVEQNAGHSDPSLHSTICHGRRRCAP